MAQETLQGLRILIIEDEALIAMLIEDMLADLGCVVVGVAPTIDSALKRMDSLVFDAAILDVNLNGAASFPVAHALMHKRVPFVFSTGYGDSGIPEALRGVPVLAKPFEHADLVQRLIAALG